MKKTIIFILLLNSISLAQYYGERSTEQSFEHSALYFNSHFLNTFGVQNFKNAAPGLIDDPFLNLSINPANFPSLGDKTTLIYLDFRGDRTEVPVIRDFYMPDYYARSAVYYSYPPVDPRWFSQTRTEPEPVISFGFITNPIKDITNNFFIGGTYQVLYKEEKFYTVPYWIYSNRLFYDALGVRTAADNAYQNYPVEDRYAGKDEMITDGHLFSAFTGYKLTQNLTLGISVNGVIHSREGEYINNYGDEYGDTDNSEHSSSSSQSRNQDYDHFDLSAGINYNITLRSIFGIKAGILNGEANQDYNSGSSYFYRNNTPEVSEQWSYHLSNSATGQVWKHEGKTSYFGFNFAQLLNNNAEMNIYYKYSSSDIDLTNSTIINDTSYNSSRWVSSYDNSWSRYGGHSVLRDTRSGTGDRTSKVHEVMININWKLTDVSTVYAGIYHKNENTETFSTEPVSVYSESQYFSRNSIGQYDYDNFYSLLENKILEWEYSSAYWTFQIPVIIDLNFNDNWGVMLGVNKIFNRWKVEDKTTAYFNLRQRNNNGEVKSETQFGERYKQPTQNFTDNMTKIVSSFYVNIANQFKVRLLIDPEFEHQFRVAQWWLSFETRI